jgi:hypothetical protein
MVLSSAWADARLMSRRPLISESVNCSGASREKVQHGYGTACVQGGASHSIFELRYCKRAYVKLDLSALAAGND